MSEYEDRIAKVKGMLERFDRDLPGEVARMNKAEAEYHTALGKFIEIFALVESQLFAFIERAARMPNTTARIVAGGWRTGNMIVFVQSLWRAEAPPAEDAFLQDAVGQLHLINNLRNSLVHYRSEFEYGDPDEPRLSTNAGRQQPSKTATEFRVSAAMLDDCVFDLLTIFTRLFTYQTRESLPPEDRAEYMDRASAVIRPDHAWRYKLHSSPPAKPPKPKRQRRKK